MNEPIVTLSTDWDPTSDPTGFWLSEKMDGVLSLWDGQHLLTRSGNVINAPVWFTASLPQDRLLGELFAGRGKFNDVLSVVRRLRPRPVDWARLSYRVFDAPDVAGPFEERLYFCCQTMLAVDDIWRGSNRPRFTSQQSPIMVVDQTLCASQEALTSFHADVLAKGGEGTMLRRPGSLYRVGRTNDLFRKKDWFQEEARVVGFNMNPDGFRSLRCQLLSDATVAFDVGSGLSASQTKDPPAIGSTVTVKFKSRTQSGALREPSFVCVRDYE